MKSIDALLLASVLLALMQSARPVNASGSSAVLRVSATVLPWLKLNASQHVARYTVTRDDLMRGYVDLPGSATVRIRTNDNRTIGVTVLNEGPERILAKASGSAEFTGSGGALVIGRPQKGAEIAQNLDLRVILPEGMREGTYALNISINPYTY
jgi:hypothetical protein